MTNEIVQNNFSECSENPKNRYPLVGIMGAIGSGKTSLAAEIGHFWSSPGYSVTVSTEAFLENPFLERFYANPELFSQKSQVYFLRAKVDQLRSMSEGLSSSCQVVDPALEMDYLFAETQHRMGWMADDEFEQYSELYRCLVRECNLPTPDIFVVVTVSYETLIRRIKGRSRELEMWMLLNHPNYFRVLNDVVGEWYNKNRGKHPAVIQIASGLTNFVEGWNGRYQAMQEIGNWAKYYLANKERANFPDGTTLILPKGF